MSFEKWSVQPDGKGAFNACFETEHPITGEKQWQAARSGISEAEATAHVEMAERHNRENAARQKLIGHLFNKANWKMPTKRMHCKTADIANAVADALSHYCGGAEMTRLKDGSYSVGSRGYYHYIGA
jgi:hypothetical protein